jgi:UDP-N-acetylglucosamine--N-acetylmuramyl-(pentapeptide) pyrophosphoryl-undecaprenol N-acetylglucosamine transferase
LLRGWEIIHQSGERDCQATQALYARARLHARVVPFVSDMPALLSRANLAISRAGGTTLAELAAAGVPTVLVPYPHATDRHQQHNARFYAEAGGCMAVEQTAPDERLDERLAAAIEPVLADPVLRHGMSEAMRRRGRPDAAWRVATLIAEIAQPVHRTVAA